MQSPGLKRFFIRNFKSIRSMELEGLPNLVLFMGHNNAGKSNILDAFKFLADAAISFDHALASRGGEFTEVIHRKRPGEKLEFKFEFALDPAQRAGLIERLFTGNKSMTPGAAADSDFLTALRWRVTVGAGEFSEELLTPNLGGNEWFSICSIRGVPGGGEAFTGQLESLCKRCSGELPAEPMALEPSTDGPFRLRLGWPDGAAAHPVSVELAEAVRQQFAGLEVIDPMRRLPVSAPIQGGHMLAADASNLPDVLHWLYNNKPKLFRRIETEVGKLVPQLGRLYTPTQQAAATLGMMDRADEDLVYSMNQLSFGTRSVVAIISKVILAPPGSWLCIEEPETYLHPQAQLGLFQFLRAEAATKRIFAATHSTPIAAACPLASLFIVQRDGADSTAAKAVTVENAPAVIAQLGVTPSFNFDAEAVVWVEDAARLEALETWARSFPFHAAPQFLPAEGAATLRYCANARVILSKLVHAVVFAIFDTEGDAGARARKKITDQFNLPPEQVLAFHFPDDAGGGLPDPVRQFFEKIEAASKPHWKI